MKPRILVIGLDAATFDLIEPWVELGALPSLGRLMRQGTRSRMVSTPNMHSASAWTSILTGLNPGRHGLFVFQDRDFASGRYVFFKGGDRTGETIAGYLGRAGMTSGFVNVPMTYPAQCQPGGFMISGLDAPALNEKAFCPGELGAEIRERFHDYAVAPAGLGDLMRSGRTNQAIEAWIQLTRTQTAAAEHLLDSRPVDFFMVVYTASDWGGHNLWSIANRLAPDAVNPINSDNNENGNALLSIYETLDGAIARLLSRVSDETQIYIISDHGMGPHTGASYHLAAWLESKGYMVRKAGPRPAAKLLASAVRASKRILPDTLKEGVKSSLGQERLQRLQSIDKDSFYSSIDWERTTAYAEPGRHIINLNLAGRNQRGIVRVEEYDRLCDQISQDLAKWTDDSGRQVVDRVVRCTDVYHGPYARRASDLHVYWQPGCSLGEPPAEVKDRGFWWSGDHRPEGIIICKGPGIKTGTTLDACSIYDFLPTVMHLAGLAVPAGLDGKVLEAACTERFREKNPVRFQDFHNTAEAAESSLSDEEEKMIAEKLRGLGYM